MTPNERPTPLTDESEQRMDDIPTKKALSYFVPADFARTLERSLAERTEERDKLKAKLATINHIAMSLFVRSTSSEVTGEMAEIGRLSREDGQ